jgi:hypothetical protein
MYALWLPFLVPFVLGSILWVRVTHMLLKLKLCGLHLRFSLSLALGAPSRGCFLQRFGAMETRKHTLAHSCCMSECLDSNTIVSR